MDKQEIMQFPRYEARTIRANSKDGASVCYQIVVGVYEITATGEKLLGEYNRNYSTMFRDFWHFKLRGKHLALYSSNYTCTRIMEIQPGEGFKDIGGEEPHGEGFCPTDYYVPQIKEQVSEDTHLYSHPETSWKDLIKKIPEGCWYEAEGKRKSIFSTAPQNSSEEFKRRLREDPEGFETGHVFYPQTAGFVAGCVWGDDSSWKIQYLDLSKADEGILRRDERFGYIELPHKMTLQEAIDTEYSYYVEEEGLHRVRITASNDYWIETGKRVNSFG